MHQNDIAFTGLPRSGSTLSCHLVNAADNAVALFEPMDIASLPREVKGGIDGISGFFVAQRERLLTHGQAWSKHVGGVVPDNPFDPPGAGGRRERKAVEYGWVRFARPLRQDFRLMVKHNAAFAALLPELGERLPVYALVRNPLAVLASWQTVDIPPRQGRAVGAEHFDRELAARLDGVADRLQRQIHLLDWFFSRFRAFVPEARVLHYEDMIASGGQSLYRMLGLEAHGERALRARNANPAYRQLDLSELSGRLRETQGAYWHFYSPNEVVALERELSKGE